MNQNIEQLIIKFLNKSASVSELDLLEKLLEDKNNQVVFKELVRVNHLLNRTVFDIQSEDLLQVLLEKLRNEKKQSLRVKRNKRITYVAAAVLIMSLGIGLFMRKYTTSDSLKPVIINSNINVGTNKAVLTLEDGSNITLEKGNQYKAENVQSNGEKLVYHEDKTAINALDVRYNTLTIPRGAQFYLQLPDSTKIWLNSDSQLRYPTTFRKAETRSIELVYGEIYLEVAPSKKHNGMHFKVRSRDQEVEVLGTEFNIKAYKEEQKTYTTLVNGSISLHVDGNVKLLHPNEQAVVSLNQSIKISPIEVYDEISWKDGVFSFKGKTLEKIMTVLSRWYDIDFIFENPSLKGMKFVGVLGKNQEITEILKTLKNIGTITNYQINDKTVILK
ncbi:FecR family protein [Flavobacteriaceae bacterium F08102]|nr:FecR family protein [Flavobacteriaceae bacterium F08102]